MIDELVTIYAHRTLPFEAGAAEACARYHHEAISKGFSPAIEDLMIASICKCSGSVLVTRNVRDFDFLDIEIFNPFGADEGPSFD